MKRQLDSEFESRISREVGLNLYNLREKNQFTREQLSEKSGIDVKTIYTIENHVSNPHIETLFVLARALDAELQTLFIFD